MIKFGKKILKLKNNTNFAQQMKFLQHILRLPFFSTYYSTIFARVGYVYTSY